MNARTNAEKEWLRKMTSGQAAAKEEVKHPHRAAEAQTPTMEAGKKSLEQNLEKSLELLGVVRTVFRNDMEELS